MYVSTIVANIPFSVITLRYFFGNRSSALSTKVQNSSCLNKVNKYNSIRFINIMIPYIEKRLSDLSPKQSDEKLPQAAVLILITHNENDYSIVFTERSKKLPSHAGEVAFPGGKKEEEDRSLIETVLRETHEEIGIEPNSIRILGRMDPQESRFGISVTPYVGYAAGSLKFKKDPKEVETIFSVPLNYLKEDPLISNKITNASGETFETPVINYENQKIWGLTLGFTLQFLELMEIDIDIDDLYFRSA